MKWLTGILDRLLAVAGALLLSQAPLFMAQYEHQLEGHVRELQLLSAKLSKSASRTGKTLPEYQQYFLKSKDATIASQGKLIEETLERQQSLEKAYAAIAGAPILQKPFLFLFYLNPSIARDTLGSFQPGMLWNVEGLVYALLGIGLGYLLFTLLCLIFRKLFRFSRKTG